MPITKLSITVPTKAAKADEKTLQGIVDDLEETQAKVLDLITELLKKNPLAPATKTALDAQKRICDSSRAPELKDLAKSEKRGELHTNLSKLQRLVIDLNKDVAAINAIEAGFAKALDDHFKGELEELAEEITTGLPRGVIALEIGLKQSLEAFQKKNSKEHWAHFAAHRVVFILNCETKAAEIAEEKAIRAFMADPEFLPLKYGKRQKIVEDSLKEGKKPPTVRQLLADALDDQDHPDKSRWAAYLGLGAGGTYKLTQSGTFQGASIHLTMSKDSWTADANGKVSLKDNTVEQVLVKLLKTPGWMQLHATLEVGDTSGDYPHVYLYAGVLDNDTRWTAIRDKLGKDDKWMADGQKALQDQLDKVMVGLKKKVKEAKDNSGANV